MNRSEMIEEHNAYFDEHAKQAAKKSMINFDSEKDLVDYLILEKVIGKKFADESQEDNVFAKMLASGALRSRIANHLSTMVE